MTYFYRDAIPYVADFVRSLNANLNDHVQLIVFVDDVSEPCSYFDSCCCERKFISLTGTPVEIRIKSLAHILHSASEFVAFCDIDDTMSSNRVGMVGRLLEEYPIVCNDLILTDESGRFLGQELWKSRIGEHFEFGFDFIKDKNIVGLGNTALRKEVLSTPILTRTQSPAADWFLFYQLMRDNDLKALFSSQCATFYRQHSSNIAGFRNIHIERMKHVLEVRRAHFQSLMLKYPDLGIYIDEVDDLESKLSALEYPVRAETNLFWWEESLLITQ